VFNRAHRARHVTLNKQHRTMHLIIHTSWSPNPPIQANQVSDRCCVISSSHTWSWPGRRWLVYVWIQVSQRERGPGVKASARMPSYGMTTLSLNDTDDWHPSGGVSRSGGRSVAIMD